MKKISYGQYLSLVNNLDKSDEEIMQYSMIKRGAEAFDIKIQPDPDMVELSDHDITVENALSIGNNLARWRRNGRFKNRLDAGDGRPVLVSEGDSWFQFPFLVRDIVDHLSDHYNIYSLGAAGDTAQNMVFGENKKKHREYLMSLIEYRDSVKAFLFSGAGNDIIGQNLETGKPVLLELLNDFNDDLSDVKGHIRVDTIEEKMNFLNGAYTRLISDIHSIKGLESLPIIIHGYDYTFPYQWKENDMRDPQHASKDEWLGSAFSEKGINSPDLRRAIVTALINRLYDMLDVVANHSGHQNVWVVDCRGAMPQVSDWIDEIHGTSDGFSEPADRFHAVIANALGATPV